MSEFKRLMVNSINNDINWQNCSILFDKYLLNKDKKTLIPKVIHQIWLGGDLPEKYIRLIDTIKEKNLNYEHKLWTDNDVVNYPLKNRELYDKTPNFGGKADILRYEILNNEGGIYLDTDFIGLKSFDEILIDDLEFFTGVGHVDKPECFNGLIGSSVNHPIIESVVNGLNPEINVDDLGSMYYNIGPQYFSKHFFEYITNNLDKNITLFPTVYFYPYPAIERFQTKDNEFNDPHYSKIMSYTTNETIVVHLWHSSWNI